VSFSEGQGGLTSTGKVPRGEAYLQVGHSWQKGEIGKQWVGRGSPISKRRGGTKSK